MNDCQFNLPRSHWEPVVCVCDDEVKGQNRDWRMGLRRAWNSV